MQLLPVRLTDWGLRDYGVDGQLGTERTPEEYVENLMKVCREVWRVLRPDGTFWLNIGDNYIGSGGAGGDYNEGGIRDGQPRWKNQFKINRTKDRSTTRWGGGHVPPSGFLKPKDMACIPWRVGLALQAEGWWLRKDIIWNKLNPMCEPVQDRPSNSHEYILLLSKNARYFYDPYAVKEPCKPDSHNPDPENNPGRQMLDGEKSKELGKDHRASLVRAYPEGGANLRDVWTFSKGMYKEAHFATFPMLLPERCILAGTSAQGCCPICGRPYKRIVKRKAMVIERSERTHDKGRYRSSGTMKEPDEAITLGWQATCKCDAGEPEPCRVLDPFSGAGTTGLVCAQHRRDFIGVELNPDYIKLAQARMVGAQVEMDL